MRRLTALILALAMVVCGCGGRVEEGELNTSSSEKNIEIKSLEDEILLSYVEDTIYSTLVDSIDENIFFVEDVSSVYISEEYLEETEYNSKANIFFGYTLEEINKQFGENKYVYTLDEDGKTTVEELVEIEDSTYDKIIRNVLIGTGVIVICVTVAVVTKNPAHSAAAGKTIKMIFTASSTGAKAGAKMAVKGASIGAAAATITEATQTDDLKDILNAGLIGASEGFKTGAIIGVVQGINSGIHTVNNTKYFKKDTIQAEKYPDGVKITKATDGKEYLRFEDYAKATAKFEYPTSKAVANGTALSGIYGRDARLANIQCGYTTTPQGYVWHHVEDMKTMILIPKDLHNVAIGGMPHTGGASLIKTLLNAK